MPLKPDLLKYPSDMNSEIIHVADLYDTKTETKENSDTSRKANNW